MIARFSHFSHAVKSIDDVLPIYEKLWGLKPSARGSLAGNTAVNAFLPIGQNFIELLQPTTPQSPVSRFINERGEGIYHLCWVVDDVEKVVQDLRSRGAEVSEIPPHTDMSYKLAWVLPRSTKGILVELLEEGRIAHLQHHPRPGPLSGPLVAFTHVHHAVKSLEDALATYDRLWGLKPIKRLSTQGQGVNNAIVRIGCANYVELLEPTDPNGLVAKYIEKRGEGLRSLCLTVRDYAKAVRDLRAKGVDVAEFSPDTGNFPVRSAWISPRHMRGLLVEIAQHQEMLSFQDPDWTDE